MKWDSYYESPFYAKTFNLASLIPSYIRVPRAGSRRPFPYSKSYTTHFEQFGLKAFSTNSMCIGCT